MSSRHEAFMQLALNLASQAVGLTRPNPPVGAVIVKGARVIGQGWHKKAGGPHAEVMAVASASEPLKGASIYVTLEPCSTTGRTPPCCELILKHGIKKVYVSALDQNPLHAGGGITLLRKAGVEVTTGVLQEQGERLLEPFTKAMLKKLPWVTLKLATSLDGRIADHKGVSQWITGSDARIRVQELRRSADAIMVGAGTVKADNPSLLPRPAKGRKPYRIVVDGALSCSPTSTVFTDEAADRTLVLTLNSAPASRIRGLEKKGARVHQYPGKTVPLGRALKELCKTYDIIHVLCEGGGELSAGLVKAKLVDRYQWFTAPMLIGGADARASIGGKGRALHLGSKLMFEAVEMVGQDVLISAVPLRDEEEGSE